MAHKFVTTDEYVEVMTKAVQRDHNKLKDAGVSEEKSVELINKSLEKMAK